MTDKEYLKALGANIRARRMQLGLTQTAIMQELGMNLKTLSRIECAVKEPQITTLKKIAEVLQTNVQSLLP